MIFSIEKIIEALDKIRKTKPLVINITNFVAMNTTANALLAIGASPAMAHWHEDVCSLADICGALVLNPGTPEDIWINAMILAGKRANKANKPVILDPVGSGATDYRTNVCKRIIQEVKLKVIRGNASEIISLSEQGVGGKGVDSTHSSDAALETAKKLAGDNNLIVAVSGEKDYITDGKKVAVIEGGNPLITFITGMGCSLTSITGAFLAISVDSFEASVAAHVVFKVCAEIAGMDAKAPASFEIRFVDALFQLTDKEIQKMAKVKLI